jgi:hypothetical protein
MFLGASRSLLGDSLDDSDYQKAATGNFDLAQQALS